MRMFFYGSLMDSDLLSLVCGREPESFVLSPARLRGFERRRARDESFPIIVPHPDGLIDGVVAGGFTEGEIARIQFYESDDYRLGHFEVEVSGESHCVGTFLPTHRLEAEDAQWHFETWQLSEKPMCMALAAELMSHFGILSQAECDALWDEMKARALERFFGRTPEGLLRTG